MLAGGAVLGIVSPRQAKIDVVVPHWTRRSREALGFSLEMAVLIPAYWMVHVGIHGSGIVHDIAFLAIPECWIVELRERIGETEKSLNIPVRDVLFMVEL